MSVDTRARNAAADVFVAVEQMQRSPVGAKALAGSAEGFHEVVERRRRSQRVVAIVVSLLVAALGFAMLERAFRSEPLPADEITVDNVADLQPLSRVQLEDGALQGLFLVTSEDLVVVASDRSVTAYPSDCGDPCDPLWSTPPLGQLSLPPLIGDDLLLVGGRDGRVSAFPIPCAAEGGVCDPLWSTPIGSRLMYGAIQDGILFASDGQKLSAFPLHCEPTDGVCDPIWHSPALGSTFRVEGAGDLVVVFTRERELFALTALATSCRPIDGVCEPSWRRSLPGADHADAIALDHSFLLTWDGSRSDPFGGIAEIPLSCFGLPDCQPLWTARFRVHLEMSHTIIVGDGVAAVGLMAMDDPDGRILTFPLSCRVDGGECEPLAEIHSNYYPVTISGGVLYTRGYYTGADAYPIRCDAPCEALWSEPRRSVDPNHYDIVKVEGDRVFMLSALSGDPGNRLYVFGLGGGAEETGAGEAS